MHPESILVSSRDGLFIVERNGDGSDWAIRGPVLAGHDVSHARRYPANGDI